MQVSATRGENSVSIVIDGASPKLLKQAEQTALRLLGDNVEAKPKPPFGFVPAEQQ